MLRHFIPLYVLALLFACTLPVKAQVSHHVTLHFLPVYSTSSLVFENGSCTIQHEQDTFKLTRFRFYVSNIVLMNAAGEMVWKDTPAYHLVDVAEKQNLDIKLPVPDHIVYSTVTFNLGIDSATNAAGAAGGDLDPLKGMYWAWHSGYINLKLEGNSPVCKTRKHEFQLHLGGFRVNENCEQKLTFDVKPGTDVSLRVDLAKLMKRVDLSVQPMIMTPGTAAVKLSKDAVNMFEILPQQ